MFHYNIIVIILFEKELHMSKLFSQNRKKFIDELPNNSIFIAFAGNSPNKRGDEHYPFAPQRNFYYLTGINKPKIILMIHKIDSKTCRETLFIEPFDPVSAKWVGPVLTKEQAEELSGITTFRFINTFESAIGSAIFHSNVDKVYMDLEHRSWNAKPYRDVEFAGELKARYPHVTLHNAYPIFAKLRMIKSKEEVRLIKKAIAITREGINAMVKNMKPGMEEYEIEAYFNFTLLKKGVRNLAFTTIAAAGKNATILHYVDNNTKTTENDLILFDLGAQFEEYNADISRTFPVSGKFTERQKELYNIVLGAQAKVFAAIKPGVPFSELNEVVKEYYFRELKKIGLIDKKEDVAKYYYHGVSHMLGLETHDINLSGQTLKKGMVFTVEPGLYIEEEGIGIRIEDDVLVTETGCEILSDGIMKTVEEIEEFMAKK